MPRNELAFIPDNISAISYASLMVQPTIQHDIPQFQTDSTDNLVEEILKQRAERLQKQEQKGELGSLDEVHKKLLFDIKDSNEMGTPSEMKQKQSNKTFYEKKSHHDMIPQLNESMAERQEISEGEAPVSKSRVSNQMEKSSRYEQPKSKIYLEDRIQTLHNQTNQQIQLENENNEKRSAVKQKKRAQFYQYEEEQQKFSLPKIDVFDKLHNESVDNQIELKLNVSQSPSERRVSSQSQYSMQMHNFIEEEASEENSQPKSSNSSRNGKLSVKNSNKNPSYSHQSHHSKKIANEIQALSSRLQAKHSDLDIDTPINMFDKPTGKFEFTPQAFPSVEQDLVTAITMKLNRIEKPQFKNYDLEPPKQPKQSKNAKRIEYQPRQTQEEEKFANPMEEVETDYSDLSRDLKIIQHRYESNLGLLSDQTKQLIEVYESMIKDEEIKQLKKQIMMLQIHNHRTKISLRNASYTKRFNYISPIPKNNDKPIEYKPKVIIEKHLFDKVDELGYLIQEEQRVSEQQQAKLTLLTKYYNIMKEKKISNNQENPIEFQYNSKLGRYTIGSQSVKHPSEINIDIPFSTTNEFNITSVNSFHGTNKFNQSPILKKGMKSPQKRNSPKKKAEVVITQPYQQYNLLKYKTEISRQMMLQFEVYNLGRLKRIRDQNRMIKKELEFVDQHIEHFDRSFAEELKQYQEMAKPKITYQTFKTIQQETPFTKSPMSRDYYGNCKGSNNINIYRPDSVRPSPLKSKGSVNKSLSQSKYTIKRDNPINQSPSKKDITLSQNFLLSEKDDKSDTLVSFFRKRVSSPQKAQNNEYCLYTSNRKLKAKQETLPNDDSIKQRLNFTRSQKSLSPRSKNLLRFNTQSQAELSMSKNSAKSPRLRISKNNNKESLPSNKNIESEYFLSIDGKTSNK